MASPIQTLTMQKAAPGLRELRQQVGRVTSGSYANPNVKRMTIRDALAGYGQGVGNLMESATSAATSEYNATPRSPVYSGGMTPERAADRNTAMTLALAKQKLLSDSKKQRIADVSSMASQSQANSRYEQDRQDAINADARHEQRMIEDRSYNKLESNAAFERQKEVQRQNRMNQKQDMLDAGIVGSQAELRQQGREDRLRNQTQGDVYNAQENNITQDFRLRNMNLAWQKYLDNQINGKSIRG